MNFSLRKYFANLCIRLAQTLIKCSMWLLDNNNSQGE